jgi:hypothetical protein
VARKVVVYAYWILKKNVTYKELGGNYRDNPWEMSRGAISKDE